MTTSSYCCYTDWGRDDILVKHWGTYAQRHGVGLWALRVCLVCQIPIRGLSQSESILHFQAGPIIVGGVAIA